MKQKIAVFFGGKSVEHDISIITGVSTLKNINKNRYDVIPVYIQKNGVFITADNLDKIDVYKSFDESVKNPRQVSLVLGKPYFLFKKGSGYKKSTHIDAAILCTHGGAGENGALAGALEVCGIPCSASGVLSLAITMDKCAMKDIFYANNIHSLPYVNLCRCEVEKDVKGVASGVLKSLGLPLIVKPSGGGSSIGISVAKTEAEFEEALLYACRFDGRILVESFLENAIEINCAAIGNEIFCTTSKIEIPLKSKDILSFNDKYIEKTKKLEKKLPVKLEEDVKKITERLYKIFNASGVIRIDYLYDKKNKTLYVNEINSIPGSLAYYLFSPTKFENLIEELIINSFKTFENKLKNKTGFDSSAIDLFSKDIAMNKYAKR